MRITSPVVIGPVEMTTITVSTLSKCTDSRHFEFMYKSRIGAGSSKDENIVVFFVILFIFIITVIRSADRRAATVRRRPILVHSQGEQGARTQSPHSEFASRHRRTEFTRRIRSPIAMNQVRNHTPSVGFAFETPIHEVRQSTGVYGTLGQAIRLP